MSQEELRRVEVLARVRSHQLRVSDAARLMRVSYRQAKRLWKRYREEGAGGLKHRSAGRVSNRACPWKFRQQALDLVREKYGGAVGERFGPTLAAEHLGSEDNLQVNAETLRLWMLQAGLWSRERKRRKQISSHAQANVYLERDYLPEHNARFARVAAKLEDYHRRAPRAVELDRIFRLERERTISEDWVVRYENRFFQLASRQYAPAEGKVMVCEGRHGSITIEYRGRALSCREIAAPARPKECEVKPTGGRPGRRKWVPPANHPWRGAILRAQQKRELKAAALAERASLALPSASP
jgi:hypothetical protein